MYINLYTGGLNLLDRCTHVLFIDKIVYKLIVNIFKEISKHKIKLTNIQTHVYKHLSKSAFCTT